jgi:hypothetical protein
MAIWVGNKQDISIVILLFTNIIALQLLDYFGIWEFLNNSSKSNEVYQVRIYNKPPNYYNPCFDKLHFPLELICYPSLEGFIVLGFWTNKSQKNVSPSPFKNNFLY